jgi:hypothetical protein
MVIIICLRRCLVQKVLQLFGDLRWPCGDIVTTRTTKDRITFYNPIHHDEGACDPRGNDPHELVRSAMSIDVFSTRPHDEGYAGTLREPCHKDQLL